MSRMTPVISDFTRGELSPRMQGRTDAQAYYQGVSELKNMIVLPQGGVTKRPGFRYDRDVHDQSRPCRLIPFSFDRSSVFLLEFGHQYIKVIDLNGPTPVARLTTQSLTLDVGPTWQYAPNTRLWGESSGAHTVVLESLSSTSYRIAQPSGDFQSGETLRGFAVPGGDELTAAQGAGYPQVGTASVWPIRPLENTPFYSEDDLPTIQWAQIGSQVVFVNRKRPPMVLTYYSASGWTWGKMRTQVPRWHDASRLRMDDE